METSAALADPVHVQIALRLLTALGVGALIGLERSYHGRPAGFRTHALVCLSTAMLMMVPVYESRWLPAGVEVRTVLDPTRMAQGIMTGIGFLGAGTILRQGLSVRGLTTAASIWMTAAIGVLVGIGFVYPALLATVLTLGTLSVFRWIESRMPSQFYAHLVLRFAADAPLAETSLRELLSAKGFSVARLSYRLDRDLGFFEYRMTIRSQREGDVRRLSDTLGRTPDLREFRIAPMGD